MWQEKGHGNGDCVPPWLLQAETQAGQTGTGIRVDSAQPAATGQLGEEAEDGCQCAFNY